MPEKSVATVEETTASTPVSSPDVYELAGEGVAVSYFPKGAGGAARFTYHDSRRAENFVGDQLRVVPISDLGTVVSVTIASTVDVGSTSFSILIPDINLPSRPAASTAVFTEGITTFHRFSFLPPNQRQRETYTVIPLRGTASLV